MQLHLRKPRQLLQIKRLLAGRQVIQRILILLLLKLPELGKNQPMIIVFAISGLCAGLGGAIIGLRSGTAQALGLQYVLLAGTVAAFIGGVSIMGGKGGVIGAAIGTLSVNFLNTGLVFNVTPAFMVQLYLGILLIIVIMFQTGSRVFDENQRRKQILDDADNLAQQLSKRRKFLKAPPG